MKKKILKCVIVVAVAILIILTIYNLYKWCARGNQYIEFSMNDKVYSDSEAYVSIKAFDRDDNSLLDTKTKIKLLDSKGKKVKNVEVSYEDNNAVIEIPKVASGKYILEANVSSKAGKDIVKKEIYISESTKENITITMDKGIYKPGDTVEFRALITDYDEDKPISSRDVNVSIYDGNDNRVYNEDVRSSDYGILSGKFNLANEVNSGEYKLVVKTDLTSITKQFKVNPYVTPKYEVKINYDKERYLKGDTAKITLDAQYFFGEPVVDAEFVVYLDGEELSKIKSDGNGKAILDYKIEEAKQYNLNVEAVDSSNFFVETSSSFSAGTDIFEIEMIPFYGSLISGVKNEIYVFTENADGTPVKTYLTVNSGKYSKQIATDENGIATFSIDIDASGGKKTFNVVAEDINGGKVSKEINFESDSRDLLISTDKVKYNQGEDINLNIKSAKDEEKTVYFFKNDRLIKVLTTDSDSTSVNLGNNYGLIDVYVTEATASIQSTYEYYYDRDSYDSKKISSNRTSYKRTIFVKPSKVLNVDISTDKEEYNPGDKISISFDTKDENGKSVDSALLVSMLDNSVLNLADNDLSIDNIRLALSDINFSEDLDAATLYASILDDNSEQTLIALLLKQKVDDVSVSDTPLNNFAEKESAKRFVLTTIIVLAVIIFVIVFIKLKWYRKFFKYIAEFIVFDAFTILLAILIRDYLSAYHYYDELITWWMVLVITIIDLVIYCIGIMKVNKYTIITSNCIFATFLLGIVLKIFYLFSWLLNFELTFILWIVFFAIVAILIYAQNKDENSIAYQIVRGLAYECKFMISVVCSFIISVFLSEIFETELMLVLIFIIVLYIVNYIMNYRLVSNEDTKKNKNGKNSIRETCIIVGLILLIFLLIIEKIVANFSSTSVDSVGGKYFSGTDASSDITFGLTSTTSGTMITGNDSSSGIINFDMEFNDMNGWGEKSTTNIEDQSVATLGDIKEETYTVTDAKIRNVFLESMCFVPELVTNNGSAKLDLDLSDNITTWTIQTVGNTKDGRVGYGSIDNVKVFKDFFVDFELPTNCVESDQISIPITVYNYTKSEIEVILKIREDDWFTLNTGNDVKCVVPAESTYMDYVEISILKSGEHVLRVEGNGNSNSDIVEKKLCITPNGYKIEKVTSSGELTSNVSEDVLFLDKFIDGTASAKIKIYPSMIAQSVEGIENIFKMPTGCFEQVSSSLYPDILALKYIRNNKVDNKDIEDKAEKYILEGYQKLLTYEVKGEPGGFSLYGYAPAETVLTAYGLMQFNELKDVYDVDNRVMERMKEFLYKKQNSDGTFEITGTHLSASGGYYKKSPIINTAYIAWALSEVDPGSKELANTVSYLKENVNSVQDSYTLALIANVLVNVNDSSADTVISKLVDSATDVTKGKSIESLGQTDYYGSSSRMQSLQTTALTSLALSKSSKHIDENNSFIEYIISQKDSRGTWSTTQATTFALRALNEYNKLGSIKSQTISIKLNDEEQKIEVNNPLDYYMVEFNNINKENKLNINFNEGTAYYEVVQEYYMSYEDVDTSDKKIKVEASISNNVNVNDILHSNIDITNNSNNFINNGMVTISVPQGCSVIEESLMKLEKNDTVKKYEYSYGSINIYLRDLRANETINFPIDFRANYPAEITGLAIRVYDYYNPDIEGILLPRRININE